MREDKSLSLILYQKSENLSQYILLNNKNMFKVVLKTSTNAFCPVGKNQFKINNK